MLTRKLAFSFAISINCLAIVLIICAQDGAAAAGRYSAHAGYSEHQTGLALDVTAPGGTLRGFKKTAQYTFLDEKILLDALMRQIRAANPANE